MILRNLEMQIGWTIINCSRKILLVNEMQSFVTTITKKVLLTPVLSFHYPIPDANGPLQFFDDWCDHYLCDFSQLSMLHTLVEEHHSLHHADVTSVCPAGSNIYRWSSQCIKLHYKDATVTCVTCIFVVSSSKLSQKLITKMLCQSVCPMIQLQTFRQE